MTDQEIRFECIKLAESAPPAERVALAKAIYQFVTGAEEGLVPQSDAPSATRRKATSGSATTALKALAPAAEDSSQTESTKLPSGGGETESTENADADAPSEEELRRQVVEVSTSIGAKKGRQALVDLLAQFDVPRAGALAASQLEDYIVAGRKVLAA